MTNTQSAADAYAVELDAIAEQLGGSIENDTEESKWNAMDIRCGHNPDRRWLHSDAIHQLAKLAASASTSIDKTLAQGDVVLICGGRASGKTSLAIDCARAMGREIVYASPAPVPEGDPVCALKAERVILKRNATHVVSPELLPKTWIVDECLDGAVSRETVWNLMARGRGPRIFCVQRFPDVTRCIMEKHTAFIALDATASGDYVSEWLAENRCAERASAEFGAQINFRKDAMVYFPKQAIIGKIPSPLRPKESSWDELMAMLH